MLKLVAAFLLLSFHACVFADPLQPAASVYYDQAQFESAAAPLGQLSMDNFDQGQIHLSGVSVSSDVPYDGQGVGEGNGHLLSGAYAETTSKYSVTTWTFRDPVYAFGGLWNLGPVNAGLQIVPSGGVYFLPDGMTPRASSDPANWSGFWGFVSDTPIDSVSISTGDEGMPNHFGQSYSLTNLELVTPTPEPSSLLLLALGLCGAMAIAARRQCGAG